MSRWQRRVDELLFEGETVRERLDIGPSHVVVTTHRVLTFTPELEGENFRQVDRPNVTGVETSALSKANLLKRGLMTGFVGAVLLLAGVLFDPTAVFGDDLDLEAGTANDFGLGSLMDATQSMFALMMNLDSILQLFGALALLLSTVILGVYWYFRTPTLAIRLAGDEDDVHMPRPDNATDVANRLEQAILPDPNEGVSADTDGDSTSSDGNGQDGDSSGFVDDTFGTAGDAEDDDGVSADSDARW